VNETLEEVEWLGVAALVALASRRAGGGVVAFQFLAAPFRTGVPSRLGAAYGAATGSRDTGPWEWRARR
jgi:hypothetical protein